jgi:hypothetical protein
MAILNFKRNSKKNKINRRRSTNKNIKYGGNPPRGLPNIFRIYTTGIADDGREDEKCYSNIWNTFVRGEILQLIPQNFDQIQILHFDTFQGATIPSFSEERKNQLERTLREKLTNSDFADISERVTVSEFNRLPVDIDTHYPFVIIDFAHILLVINGQMSRLIEPYNSDVEFKINGLHHDGRPFYAPFLYIGYGNREQSYFEIAQTQPIPLLIISENGFVTTYEGYYIDLGLTLDHPDPMPQIIINCRDLIKTRLNFGKGILTEPVKYNKIAKILSTTQFIHNVLEGFILVTPLESILDFNEFTEDLSQECINIINENIETKDIVFFDNYKLS